MNPKEMKALIAEAVESYVRLSQEEDANMDLVGFAQKYIDNLIERGGNEAATRFVDELQAIDDEHASSENFFFTGESFAHTALVRALARRGNIAAARKEARRYENHEMKKDFFHVATDLVEIAIINNGPLHIEFAFKEALKMRPCIAKVEVLIRLVEQFGDKMAAAAALETALVIEQSDQHFMASSAFLMIAASSMKTRFWVKAVKAAAKCENATEQGVAFNAIARELVRCCGPEKAVTAGLLLSNPELLKRLRLLLNRTDPRLN